MHRPSVAASDAVLPEPQALKAECLVIMALMETWIFPQLGLITKGGIIVPYQFDWYIEKQVVYGEIWGTQTFEELKQSNADIIEYFDSVENRLVHLLICDQNLEQIPHNLLQMQKTLTYGKHPNLGWVIMIGNRDKSLKDSAPEFLMTLLAKLGQVRFKRVPSLEDALAHLQEVDQTLDWDAVNENLHAQIIRR